MYIKQAYESLHHSWRYVLGAAVIFSIWQLGTFPFVIAVLIKSMQDGDISVLEDQERIMTVLDSNLTFFLLLLSFAIGMLGIWFWTKYLHKQTWRALTTIRKKIDWKRFFFGFGLVAVSTIVLTLIDYKLSPDDYELQFHWPSFVVLALIAIVFIPLQTSFEEYLFRGYLMQGIGISGHKLRFPLIFIYMHLVALGTGILYFQLDVELIVWIAYFGIATLLLVLFIFIPFMDAFYNSALNTRLRNLFSSKFIPLYITSVIFGGMHIANPEVGKLGYIIMIYYIGTGFFLGIMTLMDEGLELALGFHAGNNLIASLLVTADWTAFQTHSIFKDISEPSAGVDILIPVLIIYPIFLGIMAWRYKWKNWGEKLFGKVGPHTPQ